ncbi:MAG: amidohydrolase, partial [Paenibacillus sp.]|nr:amidohydrolase [Paenibacillus sp.]
MIDNVIREQVAVLRHEIMEDFVWLHEHPEKAWSETLTTAFIRDRLQSLGWATTLFDDCTGVVAEQSGTSSGSRMTVALRADMDALWQQMEGEWRAIHSCGHDAHMAIVLGTARLLKAIGYTPPGRLKLIFQPAEEVGTGALKLIGQGAVDDVNFLYGVHLRPIQELPAGQACAAIQHGATLTIRGTIRGLAAHAARPHLGVNAIEAAAQLVQALRFIRTNPLIPATVKMTRLSAGGESTNIVPDFAEFVLDVRAQSSLALDELHDRIQHTANAVADQFRAGIELSVSHRTVATDRSDRAEKLLRKAIVST